MKQQHGGRREGAGRHPTKAIIHDGDGLMVTHVFPDGVADLGQGRAAVTKIGRSRVVTIPQADGSEIRILVAR